MKRQYRENIARLCRAFLFKAPSKRLGDGTGVLTHTHISIDSSPPGQPA